MNKLWKGAKAAMGMVLAVTMMVPAAAVDMVSAVDDPTIINPEPVELADGVTLYNTATAVDGEVNKWDVELRVEYAKDHMKSDTVMVIDTSKSMNEGSKLDEAKNAAKTLAKQLLPEGNVNNRIALVFFNKAITAYGFSSDYSVVESRIDYFQAKGATFTQGAIHRATELLAGSTADIKNMVLLSDGEPTLNYQIDNPDAYLVEGGPGKHEKQKQTSVDVPQSAFLYKQRDTGNGLNMWDFYKSKNLGTDEDPDWEYYYYNASNCAIAEAGYYKASNNGDLYTVALSTEEQGSEVLGRIATPGKAYGASVDDLTDVFRQIAEKIMYSVEGAEVTDVMGDGVVISSESGIGMAGAGAIEWEPVFEYDETNRRYVAKTTYRVEATDDIAGSVNSDGYALLNKKASIRYNNGINADFPVPMVKPVIVNIKKILTGHTCEQCTFYVKLEKPDGTNTIYEMGANTTKSIVSGLAEGRYSVEEIGSMRDTVDFKNYLIEYSQNIFDIRPGQGGAIDVAINNIYDTVDIAVTKHWEDNNDQDNLRKNYKLYIAIKMGDAYIEYKQLNVENTDETFVFNLPKYRNGRIVEYTVEESTLCQAEKNIYKICRKYDGDSDYSVQIEGYNITNTHSTETADKDEDKKDEKDLIVENTINPCLLNECGKGGKLKAPETGKSTNTKNTTDMSSIALITVACSVVLIAVVGMYVRRR